jgi:succinate-semialdehyde dehydrogenase/glutarate-semialdehyde dehydrogenase
LNDELMLFIDGEWIRAAGRQTQRVLNPATGAEIGQLPHATKADLDRALDAAKRGFEVATDSSV